VEILEGRCVPFLLECLLTLVLCECEVYMDEQLEILHHIIFLQNSVKHGTYPTLFVNQNLKNYVPSHKGYGMDGENFLFLAG